MKIDFYTAVLDCGGATSVLIILAKKLADLGHDVSIISFNKTGQFAVVPSNVKLYAYEKEYKQWSHLGRYYSWIRNFIDLKNHMKKSNADVNIAFMSYCGFFMALASLFTNRKLILSTHNIYANAYKKLLNRLSYLKYNKIVVLTKRIQDMYPTYLRDKLVVIENPLDCRLLNKHCENQEIKKEKTIISIGRLVPQKDFATLIRAFSHISHKYPDYKLKIFGQGELREELELLVKSLNLENNILFCGITHTPFYELKCAEIFVLSSNFEGFPMVVCEALYAGDLCISSDCETGPRELIEDGKNGWLFPVGDDKKLAELLEYCINNVDKLDNVRQNAQKSVERLYTDNIIEQWLKIF